MSQSFSEQLPEYIKVYSDVVQRQHGHVQDTVYKNTEDRLRAINAANSVLKKRFNNKSQEHCDKFNHTINLWLGNLRG